MNNQAAQSHNSDVTFSPSAYLCDCCCSHPVVAAFSLTLPPGWISLDGEGGVAAAAVRNHSVAHCTQCFLTHTRKLLDSPVRKKLRQIQVQGKGVNEETASQQIMDML